MATATLLPNAEQQFIDENGVPYANGTVEFYVPGTLTFKNTYQDPNAVTQNTNPVILDAAGRAIIFGIGDYRQILRDANGVMIWDELTSGPLEASAVGVILPCLGSQTLQAFRDCAGISSAIATAIANVALLPGAQGVAGATGPIGPTGPAGAVGPTGPGGSGGSSGTVQCGVTNSDAGGFVNVTYTTPFTSFVVYINLQGYPQYGSAVVVGIGISSSTTTGFSAQITDQFGNVLAFTPIGWFSVGQ
jgi:hypothetical protein